MNFKIIFAVFIVLVSTGCICSSVPFDETEAFDMLKCQSQWLHRYPGGKDADICRAYLKEKLEPYCQVYTEQNFSHETKDKKISLKNIIGIINPKAKEFIILGSHYDNRPVSDEEWDAGLAKKPCPGANDGASSTATLLETAKVLHSKKPPYGIVIVLFDGEDYGKSEKDMYLGSKYFAEHINDIVPKDKIKAGIILDMVGDTNLNIYIERTSKLAAPELVDSVWKSAEKLGYRSVFIPKAKYAISDDHDSLLEHGIPCIDIIDFDYRFWHTTKDTADKCSPKSLKIVGNTIIDFIYTKGSD